MGNFVAVTKTDFLVLESEIGNSNSVIITVVVPVLEALVGDDVTFNLRNYSLVRACAAVSNSEGVSVAEGDVGFCVEITNKEDESVVWIAVGVNETDEYIDCLPPVYGVVLVNIADDAPVVIGKVEHVVTVNKIVDESVVETAEGVCSPIIEIDAKVFEADVGVSSAVTLTDDSLVVEDGIGDGVSVTSTD